MNRPLLALTMGDAAGVGPEIIVGAWMETLVHEWCRPVVFGHPEIMRRAARLWQNNIEVQEIENPSDATPSPGVLPCVKTCGDDVLKVKPGKLDARAGQAAYETIVAAANSALKKGVNGVVTAPLQKEALHRAGHDFPGHTELLASLCGSTDFAMMLYLGPCDEILSPEGLAVVHVTLHTALSNIFTQITEERILAKARLADGFMRRLMQPVPQGKEGNWLPYSNRSRMEKKEKKTRPRIGICALNPHAGEGGLFGNEEKTIIRPAVEKGLKEGLVLEGPFPSDTLLYRAREGRFDAVVAMYHDQGHIALKLMGMHQAVNVTLGLPIIRTSVAHGTAFDIAWKRQAETSSLIEAIRVAALLSLTERAS